MAAIEWDVYSLAPGGSTDDPTYLATLTSAQKKAITVELDGTGSGKFVIPRYADEATAAVLAQDNLVTCRFPEIDDDPIFGFWLETGDFSLLSSDEKGGELLSFAGRGMLAYLARAIMWAHSYITRNDQPDDITDTGAIIGSDPYDNLWRLYSSGLGKKPGQILGRIIAEARAYARPQHAIPLTAIDWDYTNDSNGDPWDSSDATDEFTAQVEDNLLDVITALIATDAITIQMLPSFLLQAYNRDGYGRDLAGDAFGAGVVRFEKGVNIASELKRTLRAEPVATHCLMAGETDHYGTAALSDAASRQTREMGATGFGTGSTALNGQAAKELNQRLLNLERVSFQIANRRTELDLSTDLPTVGSVKTQPGSAAEGFYLPGPPGSANGDFWVGDTVRVHTGTESFDFDETDFEVRKITIARDDDNGELIVIPKLLEIGPATIEALQFKWSDFNNPTQITFDSAPTEGSLLVAAIFNANGGVGSMTTAGYTEIVDASGYGNANGDHVTFLYKIAGAGESATQTAFAPAGGATALGVWEYPASATISASDHTDNQTGSGTYDSPALTVPAGGLLIAGFYGTQKDYADGGHTTDVVAQSPATTDGHNIAYGLIHSAASLAHRSDLTGSGSIEAIGTNIGTSETGWCVAAIVVSRT